MVDACFAVRALCGTGVKKYKFGRMCCRKTIKEEDSLGHSNLESKSARLSREFANCSDNVIGMNIRPINDVFAMKTE